MRFLHLKGHCAIIILLFSLLVMLNFDKALANTIQKDEKFALRGKQYPLELFPLIDDLQIEQAFTRRSYMKFLMKCVFFEGHCDVIGKWLKPRTVAALNGKCLVCTENQEANMERWLLLLIHHNEDLFRIAMIKVCVDMDVAVPEDEKIKMIPYLTRDDLRRVYPSRYRLRPRARAVRTGIQSVT